MGSIGEELERLAKLRDAGDLTPQEFETLKNRLVDSAADEVLPPPDQGSVTRRVSTPRFRDPSEPKVKIQVCPKCKISLVRSQTSRTYFCPRCKSNIPEPRAAAAPSQQPHESGYLYRLLSSRPANFLRLSLGDGNRQYRYQRYEQSKRQSVRPKPSAKGKRPIRAWVWVLAALGAIVPIAAPGASFSDVIAGGAAMFFVGWLIDRAIK